MSPTMNQPPPIQPIVPSSSGILVAKMVLRALTIALTFISLMVLTTDTFTVIYEGGDYNSDSTTVKLKFNDFISYRYMLFTILLGFLYSILQLALTIVHLRSGKPVSKVLVYLDFFGDLVLLYALATGAAAGFAVSVDMERGSEEFNKFFAKGNATASMLFLGSICSAVSLVFAAFGLEHRF